MKIIKTEDIHQILQETFPKSKIPNAIDNLKMGDLEGWDSLGNFNLLLAFEKFYEIRFSMEEVSLLKSISQITRSLKKRSAV
tara:strand:- start:189 stop:434 length:246 start_codon:yes stop_codon:yes gene_type:complete